MVAEIGVVYVEDACALDVEEEVYVDNKVPF